MKPLKHAAVAVICAATALAGMSPATAAQPAPAAPAAPKGENGGCYSYDNLADDPTNAIYWKSCIEKPGAAGWMRTNAYITMGARHPKCQIEFKLFKSGEGSKVYKRLVRKCPKGKEKNRYIKGFLYSPYEAGVKDPKGSYTVLVRIRGIKTPANSAPRSPWIKIP